MQVIFADMVTILIHAVRPVCVVATGLRCSHVASTCLCLLSESMRTEVTRGCLLEALYTHYHLLDTDCLGSVIGYHSVSSMLWYFF